MVPPLRSAPRVLFRPKRLPFWFSARCYAKVRLEEPGPQHKSPKSLGGPPRNLISTLNPSLLVPNDYLDLSHRKWVIVRFPKSRGESTASIWYEKVVHDFIPFPEKSAGFLYFSRDPQAAPLEGYIRLRVTPNNASPSSFHDGHDLLSPSGYPWQIILPQVASRSNYARFRDQLLEENLVTAEELSQSRSLFGHRRRINPEATLFRLTQEFPVNFASPSYLTVVGSKTLHVLRCNLFRASRAGGDYFPWTGSAVVRFEPSTMPEHARRRVVHLRIERIVDRVVSNAKGYHALINEPQEGQLLSVSPRGTSQPWAYDMDRKNSSLAAGLRILWDDSRIS
ncbi:hypothetical protein MVEN_00944900 [Mycena venus]|uniref:Uncharacterized protein n=1 Tax=Mycena venus TaxID=2733690 RepID=A0A8H7D1N6_9AGAR|nr:hypothetical protein MVEN_00944900 [Mycena venus]